MDTRVRLLLHFDGEDGSTTIKDSSTSNNKTVTNVGVELDNSQYRFGGSSGYWQDRAIDRYLTVPASVDWDLNYQTPLNYPDATIDFWVRFPSLPEVGNQYYIWGQNDSGANSYVKFFLEYNAGSPSNYYWTFEVKISGAIIFTFRWTAYISTNTWYHIAMTKGDLSPTTRYMLFQNGYLLGSYFTTIPQWIAGDYPTINDVLIIGRDPIVASTRYYGWLDDFCFFKSDGSHGVRWVTSFIPPSHQLYLPTANGYLGLCEVDDPYTKLLLHTDGDDEGTTFIDSSSYHKTVVANGNVKTDSAQKKFGATSAYFDGVNSSLRVASSDDWYFGDEDFTIDFWVMFEEDPTPSTMVFAARCQDANNYWQLSKASTTNKISFTAKYASVYTAKNIMISSWSPSISTWYHIAFVRCKSSGAYLFINGVSQSLTNLYDSSSYERLVTSTATISTSQYKFGGTSIFYPADDSGDWYIPYSADFAFGAGNFTIDFWILLATLPPVNNGTNPFSQIVDANNLIEFKLQNIAGVYSWDFRYLLGGVTSFEITKNTTITANQWYHIVFEKENRVGTNYYSIWQNGVMLDAESVDPNYPNIAAPFASSLGHNGYGWIDEFRVSNIYRYSAPFTPPTTPYSSDANTLLLIHGDVPDLGNISGQLTINEYAGGSYNFKGWIDEFRISKGVTRWTSDFNTYLPSSAYTLVSAIGLEHDKYTKLLVHMDGTNGSTTFADASSYHRSMVNLNNVVVDTSQSKFGGASGYWDAASDKVLYCYDSKDFDMRGTDCTYDFWVRFAGYPTVNGKAYTLFQRWVSSTNYERFSLYQSGSGLGGLRWFYQMKKGGTTYYELGWLPNPQIAINTWYHVALVVYHQVPGDTIRKIITVFQDGLNLGVQIGASNEVENIASFFEIGGYEDDTKLNGWIDEFRVSKGICRWINMHITYLFTPPTRAYDRKLRITSPSEATYNCLRIGKASVVHCADLVNNYTPSYKTKIKTANNNIKAWQDSSVEY